jgi:hypothetical protein
VPPANSGASLDLAEAFARKQANYVGNTGYGWGFLGAVGLSERLMTLYTEALLAAPQTRLGAALSQAKGRYFEETQGFNAYDEKVMQQLIFYGLPMMIITVNTPLPADDAFPGVVVERALGAEDGDIFTSTLKINFTEALATHTTTATTTFGQYLSMADHTFTAPNQPVQPFYFTDTTIDRGPARALVLRSASFADQAGFDALVAAPYNEFYTSAVESLPGLDTAWYPPTPLGLQVRDERSNLVSQLGAFHPISGTLRVYSRLEADVIYSSSPDHTGPHITVVDSLYATGTVTVKVGAADPAGIREVVVSYFTGSGQAANLKSVSLSYESQAQKWQGIFPGDAQTRYFVQVVDQAGNVTTATNKGQYYAPAPLRSPPVITPRQQVFLPIIDQ